MKTLTERQKEILNFLAEFTNIHSFPPTFREIGTHFEISLRAVQDHLGALEKKGFISTASDKKRSRCIKIVQKKHGDQGYAVALRIPILGRIAAGTPILCEENYDGYVSVAASDLKPGKHYFLLKVDGKSMVDAGILDGDLALIEERHTAENGQIVAAVIDNTTTLKRFYRDADRVRLVPENSAFPVQEVYTDVRIAGILFRIMRKY